MDLPLSPPSPPFQLAAAEADGELSPNRRRLLALLAAQHEQERVERRIRQAADPFNLAADERGLLLLAAVGLLLFLCLLALHSPPTARSTVSERPPMDEAWLSQWTVRRAELPWSEKEMAALHKQLKVAMSDSWPVEESHYPLTDSIVPTAAALPSFTSTVTAAAEDDSSPLPVSLLPSSSAISESGFRGMRGVVGTACSRQAERAECGERRQCGGHGQCVVRDEYCRGFYRYREWKCDCNCGWGGVWCQRASSECSTSE